MPVCCCHVVVVVLDMVIVIVVSCLFLILSLGVLERRLSARMLNMTTTTTITAQVYPIGAKTTQIPPELLK